MKRGHATCSNLLLAFIWTALIGGAVSQYFEDEEPPMYCFQCHSGIDPDCKNIQPNDTSSYHFKPCLDTDKYNGSKPFCRKVLQKIFPRENLEIVIRKCGWVRHPRLDCYSIRNEDHTETNCQCFESGCNEATVLQSSTALLVGAAVLLGQRVSSIADWSLSTRPRL